MNSPARFLQIFTLNRSAYHRTGEDKVMITFSKIAVRLAIAYLLLVNSVDTLSNTAYANHTAFESSWTNLLLVPANLITIAGSVLLAFGWRLRDSALVLATCTAIFALIYQEPVALFITAGLLTLAYDAHNQPVSIAQPTLRENSNATNQTKIAASINDCERCGC
jgi:hypothetical protein